MTIRPVLFASSLLLSAQPVFAQKPSWGQVISAAVVVTSDAQGRASNGTAVTVVVRELHAPTKAIARAQASLTAGDSSQAWEADPELLTDSAGVVSLRVRSSGPYEVRLRRVGYPAVRVRVWLPADCRNTLEVYMVLLWCDIGPCPSPPPARATLTTCRARAA